jgi:hypothetical protein
MANLKETGPDVLVAHGSEEEERAVRLSQLEARLFGHVEPLPETPLRRPFRRVVSDALHRVWYRPPPEDLTEEEMRWIMRSRDDEDDSVPERVPPDNPDRLAWEAELRALGIRPAKKWSFPNRPPLPKITFWTRLQERFRRGL